MKYIFLFCSFFVMCNAQAIQWIDKNVAVEATFMGYENIHNPVERQYFCRENNRTDGTTVVGKAILKQGRPMREAICYIPWGGKENKRTENFDVLLVEPGWTFSHVDSSNMLIELDSYERGNPPKATYGCKHNSSGMLGKYFVEHRACYYPYAGSERKETNKDRFVVLTYCSPNSGVCNIW